MTDVHAVQSGHQHHEHDHDHHHHDHDHGHEHRQGWLAGLASALHLPGYGHTHERPPASDAMYENELGIRTLKIAFLVLGVTTLIQVVIVLMSGSVALLADTVHNFGDALNSLPLWIAFVLLRKKPSKRYTYGFGKAEDLAGLVIVLSIVFSAGYIFWESVQKLINPEPLTNLGWVAAAALIGFVGNEIVALTQTRVGKQIGSAAMIADGKHARIDGFTSLSVLIAVVGTWLGYPIVDPIIGVLIAITIVFIARDASISMWHRLMDAVDPDLVEQAEKVLKSHEEVKGIIRLQMRWVGHRLHGSFIVAMDDDLTLADGDRLTDHIRHHLLHDIAHLDEVMISAIPARSAASYWGESRHHWEPALSKKGEG